MFPVSAAYIAAMNEKIQRHKISGTIGGVDFNASDVLRDSFVITNQCSDKTDLTLGGVFVGVLKFTLLNNLGIERGTWRGKEVIVNFSQQVNEDSNLWETIPIGVYKVSEANHTEKGIELTCYDNMSKLDKAYPQVSTVGTIYDIMNVVCSQCYLSFGMTREEVEAMPNGSVVFGIYPDNGCKTWRDIVHFIAQLVGGFATAGRDGSIVLKRFGTNTGFIVDSTKRKTGAQFSDYVTNYTGLSVVNMAEKSTRYVSMPQDNGSTLNLGSNPFLQYGTEESINAELMQIIEEANRVQFVPFSSTMVGNPAFDLGDIITYTNGTAGESSLCCVMSYTWKINNGYSVNGFGKNPALTSAQSKAEKDLAGLAGQSKTDTLQYFSYINASELTVGNNDTLICELRATNTKDTFIDFWLELDMDLTLSEDSESAVLNFRYTLDDYEEIYKPVTTYYHNGKFLMHLMNFWRFTTIMQHSIKVYLEVAGGVVNFAVNDIRALLKGQGLTQAKEWDGRLDFEDVFSLKTKGVVTVALDDLGATIDFDSPQTSEFSDSFSIGTRGSVSIGLADEMTMVLKEVEFRIETEDETAFLITEDGSSYIKT